MRHRISNLASRAIVRAILALALIAVTAAPSAAQWRGINPVAPTWVAYGGGTGLAESPVVIEGARNVRDVLQAALAWISHNRPGWQAGAWSFNHAGWQFGRTAFSRISLFTVEISRPGEAPQVLHFHLRTNHQS